MAGALKTLKLLLAALALTALGAGHAAAEALQDPTRPPATLVEPTTIGSAVAASGFQAVIRRPGHKPMAVINGKMVELGGKLNDATLVRLSESEAVLQGPNGREVLKLTPAAEKTVPQPGSKQANDHE